MAAPTTHSPEQDPSNWQTINYKHDLYGRRSEKKVDGYGTRYLYDGPHVIAEYDGNNNLLRKYIYGPGIDQPVCMIEVADSNAVYYYHFDALGSVVALSDSSGDTVQTYEYSVFGQVAVEDINHPNPYMFAGRRFDIEIGLYYNRARYYNPFTGRFLQTDPIGYGAGMNLYAYCGNNPLVFIDPSGLSPTDSNDSNDVNDSNDSDDVNDSNNSVSLLDEFYFKSSSDNNTWWDTDSDLELTLVSETPGSDAATRAVAWALEHEGDTSYGFWHHHGGTDCHDFRRTTWKCNKFVHDAYTEANEDLWYPVYNINPPDKPWPIIANDMANGNTTNLLMETILKTNYPVVTGGLRRGDIISFPSESGSGHMGIYIGGGKMIQAGKSGVVITRITEREGYENMVVRRYRL